MSAAALATTGLPFAARRAGLVGSIIDSSTSLLESIDHPVISFAMGCPAAESIPTAAFARIADELFTTTRTDLFGYAASEGDSELRRELLRFLADAGEQPDPNGIIITTGGMQGLDIAAKLFIDPGSLVAVESPTYTNGSGVVLSYQGRVLEIDVDADGMIVEQLEARVIELAQPPRAIYTVPTFQNPSGTTMSVPRRLRLIELARQWNAVIIEDDPYGYLQFGEQQVPSIRQLSDYDPLVFSVRTFSKFLAPGLRVGWLDCDPSLKELVIAAKQAMDTCTNFPMQKLVTGFLASGEAPAHLARLRREYSHRLQAMHHSLQTHFSSVATWTNPKGGFFVWMQFDDPGVDCGELFRRGLDAGVAFIPGSAFSPSGRFTNSLRLCFASLPTERIAEGVALLAETYHDLPTR